MEKFYYTIKPSVDDRFNISVYDIDTQAFDVIEILHFSNGTNEVSVPQILDMLGLPADEQIELIEL